MPLWSGTWLARDRDQPIGALAEGGRTVNIGHSAGADQPPPFEDLRKRGASLIGMSSGWTPMARKREVYAEVLDAAVTGQINVDFEVVPLADVASAWERQQGSPHVKLVIEIGGAA